MIRDSENNALSEGDNVWIPLGIGQLAMAVVTKIQSLVANPNETPTVQIGISLSLPIAPNGAVPGVVKAKTVVG